MEKLTVAIAEDNELNMEIITSILEQKGASVTKAIDGEIVTEIFEKSDIGKYPIILMDIMMPNKNGLEATKLIRNLDRQDADTVTIVAMTANAYDEDVRKSKEAGMNAHLTKPLDTNKLFEILEKCYLEQQEIKK